MNREIFFLQQQLLDFDEFCENARNWDLDYRQLDSGKYSSELLMFGNATTLFTQAKIRRSMLQQGTSPTGLVTFGLLAYSDISIHWRNADIHENQLFIFPRDGELHSITHPNFDVYTLSFSERTLEQICEALKLPDFRKLAAGSEVFNCHPEYMLQLRKWLHQFAFDLVNRSSGARDRVRLRQLEEELARHLITTLFTRTGSLCKPSTRKRDRALKVAVNYIEESDIPVSSVRDLCAITDVSERTLEYAFREHYGLSPKSFMQTYHLNQVRKMLRRDDPDSARISGIAGRYGFWHMGQFAADYKRMFRELPSETLRKT